MGSRRRLTLIYNITKTENNLNNGLDKPFCQKLKNRTKPKITKNMKRKMISKMKMITNTNKKNIRDILFFCTKTEEKINPAQEDEKYKYRTYPDAFGADRDGRSGPLWGAPRLAALPCAEKDGKIFITVQPNGLLADLYSEGGQKE